MYVCVCVCVGGITHEMIIMYVCVVCVFVEGGNSWISA